MANAQNLLAAAKKQKAGGGNKQQPVNTNNNAPRMPMGEQKLYTSSDFGSLENLYFNPQDTENDPVNEAYEVYPNGEKRKVYDAKEDLKEMANFDLSNVSSNMPKAILESFMANPLNMPTEGLATEEAINEQVQARTMDIINKLDIRDKQGKKGIQQQPQQPVYLTETAPTPSVDLDYNQLANLIENIIDKKFAQYSKVMLNEGRNSQNTPNLAFMKLGNSFTFMDDNNNVYECKMIYKGKGKVKKS